MKRAIGFVAVLAVVAATRPAQAHHSFAAIYLENKVQKIEGDLVQFVYRNPHSYVHIDAPDETGAVQRWAVEWSAGLLLTQQGVTRATLRAGDHVQIEGSPGRAPPGELLRTLRP